MGSHVEQIEKIYVKGGQLVVSESPAELITILGSCVSVCLWDRKMKTGGMNHYLLPASINGTKDSNGGATATKMLVQSMLDGASSLRNLEAKIFGGGNRFFADNFLVVGPQNVAAAKKTLREFGIPIVLEATGGGFGRKINFNTQTGEVTVLVVN